VDHFSLKVVFFWAVAHPAVLLQTEHFSFPVLKHL